MIIQSRPTSGVIAVPAEERIRAFGLGGVTIKAGDRVHPANAATNRDPLLRRYRYIRWDDDAEPPRLGGFMPARAAR